MKKPAIKIQTCSCCGKKYWPLPVADSPVTMKMVDEHVCYDCANWKLLIDQPKEHCEIIAGIYYDFLPPQKIDAPGLFLGGTGMRYILKKDGSVKKSNDIWQIGEVPLAFRDALSDTGWWVTKKLYNRLRKPWFWCNNIGCYERYHCLRYDVKQEYNKKPYNKIPNTWIVGKEKCPSFLNILEIQHYDVQEPLEL